ncbi:MAG: hypothetical protein E7001_07005 [Coriobacteriaceae bacterium]|nr:hypothetical protein [Coriobacteriaceae bacterium]
MDMKTIGIAVVAVAVAFAIYLEVQKRATFAKLEAYLREGDIESYLKVLDRPLTGMLYPKYNVLFMRLNATLALDDTEASARIIREMGSVKMNEEQAIALAVKAFAFYVEIEDEPHAREALAYLEVHGNPEMVRDARRTYEVFLKSSYSYIDEMERALTKAEGMDEALLCQMLSVSYENKGDGARAASYRVRAERLVDAAMANE